MVMSCCLYSYLKNGKPNPHAARNKARFHEYLDNAAKRGLYGSIPFVLYAGTNGLYELAVSEDPADKAMYRKLGEFVINSPLKK